MTPVRKSIISLRRNSWYSTLNMLIRLGVTIASVPVLIRGLGLAQYGVWTVLLSVVVVSSLAQLGLDAALSFYVAEVEGRENRQDRDQVLATSLLLFSGLGFGIAALICIGAPLILSILFSTMPSNPSLLLSLMLFGGVAFLQFWKQWAVAVEAGLLRYDLQTWAEGTGTVILYGGLILFAQLGYDLVGLTLWFLSATFVTLIIHGYLLYQTIGLRFDLRRDWSSSQARSLLKFGLTQWLSQIGGTLFGQADRFLINILLGPGAVGLYAAATSIAAKINELSAVPIQTIVPAISMARTAGKFDRIAAIFAHAQRLNSLVIYFIAATIMLGADTLARLLVTPEHANELVPLLRILVLVYAVYSLNAVGFFTVMGMGRPSINAHWVLFGGLLFTLLLVILIPLYKLYGAAWANIGYAVTLAINWRAAKAIDVDLRAYAISLLPFIFSMLACLLVSILFTRIFLPYSMRIVLSIVLVSVSGAWIAGYEWLREISKTSRVLRDTFFSFMHS